VYATIIQLTLFKVGSMKKECSAGIIVYYQDILDGRIDRNYVVLHYRRGYWDLPKGKLEGEETNLEAATRELKEETGLTAHIHPDFEQCITYIFKDQQGELVNKTVAYFVGRVSTKEVILSPEHLYYKWLPFKEAVKQLTYPNAQQVLRMAEKFVKSRQD
jgi:bis(5'-nucleosidyl)-tetraphosphatase